MFKFSNSMKIHLYSIYSLIIALSILHVRSSTTPNNSDKSHDIQPKQNKEKSQERRNQLINSPMSFGNNFSGQPQQQAFNNFQSGFGGLYGANGAGRDPIQLSLSDPIVSGQPSYPQQIAPTYQQGMGQGGAPSFLGPSGSIPGVYSSDLNVPYYRNENSVTHNVDDDLGFYNSLTNTAFPELRVKRQCESVQRQAVSVANNLVKRQNKIIFKELMDYVLKSKFLMGMTEVKLNRVLKEKFMALMKKYTLLSEDNVKLISSSDDEMLDFDLEDQDVFPDETSEDNQTKVDIDEDDDKKKKNSKNDKKDAKQADPVIKDTHDPEMEKLMKNLEDENAGVMTDPADNGNSKIDAATKNDSQNWHEKLWTDIKSVLPWKKKQRKQRKLRKYQRH